jgi:hypothetical protein
MVAGAISTMSIIMVRDAMVRKQPMIKDEENEPYGRGIGPTPDRLSEKYRRAEPNKNQRIKGMLRG